MLVNTREWGFEGSEGRVAIRLRAPSLARSNDALCDVVRDLTRRPRWAVRARRGPAPG